MKEQKLEEQKLLETELYRTGMGELVSKSLRRSPKNLVSLRDYPEVVDLTHPVNVELFRKWDQKEAAYVQQLRFIRISSAAPGSSVVSRRGRHPLLKEQSTEDNAAQPEEDMMDTDEAPLLLEPPSRFSSTIQTMDGV